jgi:DNA-binding CsgD family transcriptional regulator
MDTPSDTAWRAGLDLIGRLIDAAGSPDALARAAVAELPRLVASELTTLSVCDLGSGHRRVVGVPAGAIGADDRAAFDRHFDSHPLVRYHAVRRGPDTHRISDSVPFPRFRETALYADYYRRIGIDHAIAVPIQMDGRTLVSFVLNRRGRDFSDRERELLDALRVPLARLYRRTERIGHGAAADAGLTAREAEVLRWVAAGKTDRDIAALLGCSHRTVQKHLQRAYVKLGVETRTAAAMRWRAVVDRAI